LVPHAKEPGNSVGLATDYGLNDRLIGFRFLTGIGNFSLRHHVGPIQPLTQWVLWARSLTVKWPEREADHSPPSTKTPLPNTSSQRGAQLSTGTTLTLRQEHWLWVYENRVLERIFGP